jgi:hypothetical protein
MPTLRKIKRDAMPTYKPNQIAAHLILPNHTKAHPPPDKWTTGLLNKNRLNKGIKI